MKKVLFFVFICFPMLYSCNNQAPWERYEAAQKKYEGVYRIKAMETEYSESLVLFEEAIDPNQQQAEDIYTQLSQRSYSSSLGYASVSVNSYDGTGSVYFFFTLQCIIPDGNPPFTVGTPVLEADGVQTWGQTIPFSVDSDMHISWGDTIIETEYLNTIDRALLSPAKVVYFDGQNMEIVFDYFPVYNQSSKEIILIPITYHLERE